MSNYSTCAICKNPPEEFSTHDGRTAHWFVVPKGEKDPTWLMSDLSVSFCCVDEIDYIPDDDKELWCVNCVDKFCDEHDVEMEREDDEGEFE